MEVYIEYVFDASAMGASGAFGAALRSSAVGKRGGRVRVPPFVAVGLGVGVVTALARLALGGQDAAVARLDSVFLLPPR